MVDGVMFVTLHVVGTNNGRLEILKDDIEAALALTEARDQANRAWLNEAFAEALGRKATAVVIAMQADVSSANGAGPCGPGREMNCDAFARLRAEVRWNCLAELVDGAGAFGEDSRQDRLRVSAQMWCLP